MEVIEKNSHEVTCPHCNSRLKYNGYDLHWYWGERDSFYVVCPVCNNAAFVPMSEENVRMYKKVVDEEYKNRKK